MLGWSSLPIQWKDFKRGKYTRPISSQGAITTLVLTNFIYCCLQITNGSCKVIWRNWYVHISQVKNSNVPKLDALHASTWSNRFIERNRENGRLPTGLMTIFEIGSVNFHGYRNNGGVRYIKLGNIVRLRTLLCDDLLVDFSVCTPFVYETSHL